MNCPQCRKKLEANRTTAYDGHTMITYDVAYCDIDFIKVVGPAYTTVYLEDSNNPSPVQPTEVPASIPPEPSAI